MTDRLLLYLVCAFPVLLMLGTIYHRRRKLISRAQLRRELVMLGLAAGGVVARLGLRLGQEDTTSTHGFIQDPRILLLAIPAIIALLWLQLRTLAGISRGRMWLAFLLRSAIVILVALALAGLQMFVERDALQVLFVVDMSKSVPEEQRQK